MPLFQGKFSNASSFPLILFEEHFPSNPPPAVRPPPPTIVADAQGAVQYTSVSRRGRNRICSAASVEKWHSMEGGGIVLAAGVFWLRVVEEGAYIVRPT